LTGYLFLGLDCSTQGLKAVAVDEGLAVFAEFNVNFDRDLPSFKTESGVLLEEGGVVNTPVAMYLEALDLLMEKMKAG
jgi:xylulokinase